MNKEQREIKIKTLESAIESNLDKAMNTHPNKRGVYVNKIAEYSKEYFKLTGRYYIVKNHDL